jgi:hypothetical protein
MALKKFDSSRARAIARAGARADSDPGILESIINHKEMIQLRHVRTRAYKTICEMRDAHTPHAVGAAAVVGHRGALTILRAPSP